MGFYGNITSASKTQFSFDRIYPNRQKMEENMVEDGIYMGRFVLIDYDQDVTKDQYRLFYYENEKFYMFAEATAKTEVRYPGDVAMNEIIRVTSDINKDNTVKDDAKYTFWKCTGGDAEGIAQFKKVADAETNYTTNYQIDIAEYGEGRGWDSTVWQKVYTQGVAKYVMIAELNAVIPTFDIVPDAPSLAPIAPHFDQRSNNVYYKLHYQPQWGMRVKSADGVESDGEKVFSDEEIIWKKEIYNTATDEETIQYFDGKDWIKVEEDNKPTHAGAIYYNKAGFDPEIIAYDEETIDKVAVEATGISGELYNSHNGANPTEMKPAEDIQEISIMLPSIGNSISKIWDIVYGNKEQNPDKFYEDEDGVIDTSKPLRNLDINWDSTEGLRLIKEKEDGNGFTFDTDDVSTLAGAINSVHDLMGMIIVDVENEQQILDGDLDKIYYLNGKYYRKKFDYTYEDIEITNTRYFSLVDVQPTAESYHANHYYIFDNGNYIADEGPYDKKKADENLYRELVLNAGTPNAIVENLVQYEANKFFYKENYGKIYILDQNSNYDTDKIYYNVPEFFEEPITLDDGYSKDKYYYKDGKNYILEKAENPTVTRIYFLPVFNDVKATPYEPGKYFYRENGAIKLDNNEKMTVDRNYFTATIKKTETTVVQKPDGSYEYVEAFVISNEKEATLFEISNENMTYYYKDNNGDYLVTSSVIQNNSTYYTFNSEKQISNFYVKGKFYITKDNITFTLDEREAFDKNSHYYEIKNETKISMFYEPNKFVDDKGNIVDDPTKPGYDLYYKDEFYVSENSKNKDNIYSLWNNNVKAIPNTITLAIRNQESLFKKEELKGFARELNTIHGLILKINEMLELSDEKTREENNIQGLINIVNDIIYKFDSLTPDHFMIVDHYGRLHSSDFNTLQDKSYAIKKSENHPGALLKGIAGDVYEKATTVADMRKQWITMNVNGDITKPSITVHHNFQPVQNTEASWDKNSKTGAGEHSGVDKDKLNLYTPIVDDMGHVVGKNIETVTLPYGFKTISTNGTSSNVSNMNANTADIVADNTQDVLNINSHNKWIKISNNDNNNTLTIAHEVNPTSKTESSATLSNETSENVTFMIPTYSFDEAGHYTKHDEKTLTMPFGYGKIVGDNVDDEGNIIVSAASATYDTVTFSSDNWLTATVSKDKVVYSHDYPATKDDTTSASNLNGNGDIIILETLMHDEKGHIVNVNKETVTLPYGYKTFKDSNSIVGSSVASNTQDTFVFKGDSWINPTVSNDLLTLTHTGPVGTVPAAKDAVTPNFGATFTIDDWYFDDKGHKYAGGTHTVKIPQPSLNSLTTTNASVLTDLTLNATTGAFSQSSKNVGDLILTGYNKPTDGVFEATDSINSAFRKIQDQVINEISNREAAITQEISDRNTAITNAINTEITNRDNAINTAISAEVSNRNSAISTLKTEITGDSTETIASLLQKINELQSSYDAILARIEALEAYHNEENA